MDRNVDVLVVGAGPVGLALALDLGDSGVDVAVIDRAPRPSRGPRQPPRRSGACLESGMPPRVSAFGHQARDFLARMGAWGSLDAADVVPFTEVQVFDGQGPGQLSFDALNTGMSELGFIVTNDGLAAVLASRLDLIENVSLYPETTVKEIAPCAEGFSVETGEGTFRAHLLVGADGSRSAVRQVAGHRTWGWSYEQQAVVATIELARPHASVARQWFGEHGILALLPLAAPHLCSIVLSTRQADMWLAMDDETFCQRLTAVVEGIQVLGTDTRYTFPLSQRHSFRYVSPHVALVGDAAHTIHPLAGQGANIGLADAEALATSIKRGHLEGRVPGNDVDLLQYERARRPENYAVGLAMEAFVRGYQSGTPGMTWLRNQGMKLLDRNRTAKALLTQVASARTHVRWRR